MASQKKDSLPQSKTPKIKKTPKQIAALVCVTLLVAMYLITFLVACINPDGSGKLFAGCLLLTIALPILLWIYIWLYGMYKEKHTIASLDILNSNPSESEQDHE